MATGLGVARTLTGLLDYLSNALLICLSLTLLLGFFHYLEVLVMDLSPITTAPVVQTSE